MSHGEGQPLNICSFVCATWVCYAARSLPKAPQMRDNLVPFPRAGFLWMSRVATQYTTTPQQQRATMAAHWPSGRSHP